MDAIRRFTCAGALLACVLSAPSWSQQASVEPALVEDTSSPTLLNRIYHWNEVMLDSNAIDHSGPAFPSQIGPGRTARAFAIVQIAVFDAVNAILGTYKSYTGLPKAQNGTSMNAAIAVAAHDTLIALYPAQADRIHQLMEADLAKISASTAKDRGIELGHRAAAAILALRANDGADHDELLYDINFFASDQPGFWRQDPVTQEQLVLGALWKDVDTFVIPAANTFRAPPPPSLGSLAYAAAFNEVKSLGGNGTTTPTLRTADQTLAGMYWGYDAAKNIGTPPRLYNQIVVQIAQETSLDAGEAARLLALVNTAMADSGVSAWESKFFHQHWRPVGGVREADVGTGPTGLGDGNPDTAADVNWVPLGAQASNTSNLDFTPPFPAYPSGHATFGGATFQMLRNFYGTDNYQFTFVSDELNGATLENDGSVRPFAPRSFLSFSQAEEENGQSRIYLGVHWVYDKTAGITMGRSIADYVFANAFQLKK